MDRIDLQVEVPVVDVKELSEDKRAKHFLETSNIIRKRVVKARQLQKRRFINDNIFTNAEMKNKEIKKYCLLSKEAKQILSQAANAFNLSARAYFKTIKTARTIADLAEKENIESSHLAESLQYRFKDY